MKAMRTRFIALLFVIGITVSGVEPRSSLAGQTTTREGHVAWVAEALKRMQTIRPGMTRKELLAVFTTEGGLSTALRRTFVSRDCPYFKVDVVFEAVGQPNRNGEGDLDRIVTISRPYLQFSILD